MNKSLLIFSNLIIPTITGLFFFIYFIYFTIINNSKAASFKYFIMFLLSFSVFLLGRPLQMIMGPHPVQLIIVNIRVFIFCALTITSITTASLFFDRGRNPRWIFSIFLTGTVFGVVYVVFNILGTVGSYKAFEWGNLVAWDALTPSMMGPFYGREVTIAVQVLIGILLMIASMVRLVSAKGDMGFFVYMKNKNFLFNSGILLFALTFVIGSISKQWWLYYFSSMFSSFLFGAGVLIDIKEVHNNYEKLVPFIKEDIIQNVAFSQFSKLKLIEMLHCLDKDPRLDTFVIVMMKDPMFETNYELQLFASVTEIIRHRLDSILGYRNYIIIPLDNQRIGLVLNLLQNGEYTGDTVHELMEIIQQDILGKTRQETAVGIGRSYENLEDLRTSYYEALDAQKFAAGMRHSTIVHVNHIQQSDPLESSYPLKQKERLLSCIKLSEAEECAGALKDFLEGFSRYIEKRPEILKMRLYELVGAIIDAAITGGGNEKQLNELVKECFNDIDLINDYRTACSWLEDITGRVIQQVVRTHMKRTSRLVEKAKQFIGERYQTKIGYKDVAKELCISSSYFLALFKQETGMTFVDYLTDVRIKRSKELLVETSMSVTQIASEIGVSNPNYFSSMFRKHTGESAKEYRNRHTKSEAAPSV